MILTAPSILSANFLELGREIKDTEEAGADYFHIDVMDGSFVPNITIGYFIVEQVKKAATLPLDVHLMIERPDRYVKNFIDAGADILTIHYEADRHLNSTVNLIKSLGAKAGVSINPSTPVSALEDIVCDADLILVMSVNPGFGGQRFIPHSLEKIAALKAMLTQKGLTSVKIEVDGGVTVDNVAHVANAGAGMVVMGSAFYNSKNYKETIKAVREKTI
ncbi:ribulose-phosphate 3-epimerase [Candidatus Magnetominusculus xianensis]|uniref:Ribulose-phosphate 3-epimerase n=1 Tax=Candidatus Magnetominusculus xianensis TaxID=1748249 RepID=A0ABR5SFK3_9BACT|nr:ribulose-phosphate 3-epimerase [Candidatus Magnetominusculus xianensis]KWT86727.1 ribulose-phosphate 3-epimerase [Candidatus Magnetominusculus xianensis]MBF0402554.1 ribulose-phosphate 3-epimerase [Nitrospirota bacterium]